MDSGACESVFYIRLWDRNSIKKLIFHFSLTISDLNSSKDAQNYVRHGSDIPRPPAFVFCMFLNEIRPKILTSALEMASQPMFSTFQKLTNQKTNTKSERICAASREVPRGGRDFLFGEKLVITILYGQNFSFFLSHFCFLILIFWCSKVWENHENLVKTNVFTAI